MSESTRDQWRFIIWLALLTSAGELIVLGIDKFVSRYPFIHLGRDVVWMKPLADAVIFAAGGVALSGVTLLWPKVATIGRFTPVLLFTSFSSILLGVRSLNHWSALVLALGLTVVCARAIAVRPRTFATIVKRSLPVVVIGTVLVGVSVPLRSAIIEVRAVRRLPAAIPGSPNVLLIVLDTVRGDHVSVNGYSRPTTPRLQRLAQRGVVFTRAVATAPWTLPSHGSMFTGHLPTELSADWGAATDGRWPTLAEVLSQHGYLTGGFVANRVYASYEFGLNRGFQRYEDYNRSPGQVVLSSTLGQTVTDTEFLRRGVRYWHVLGRKRASDVNEEFLSWVSHSDSRPYFAFLNYYDAHEPLDPPPPFNQRFGAPFKSSNLTFSRTDHFGEAKDRGRMSAIQRQAQIDAYDDGIAYEDESLGRLLDELSARGGLENTVVIVTSDHGQEFGEHGRFGHGASMAWTLLGVPLVIVFPGRVPSNLTVAAPVSLVDLSATVADLTGIGRGSPFPGVTLSRFWNASKHDVRFGAPALSEQKARPEPMRSVVMNDLHYIRSGSGVEELYDLAHDPGEMRNLAAGDGMNQHAAHLQSLRCIIRPGCAEVAK